MEEVWDPEIVAGLNATVTPLGAPDEARATEELKPPLGVKEMVELPLLPFATETEVGEAASVKLGVEVVPPARALMRLAPLGLPHPVARS